MRKTGKKLRKEEVQGILFANIPFVGFCLFGMIPLLLSLYLCFHSFKGLRLNTAKPVGFANFQEIFADEMFWQSLNNTWFVVLGYGGRPKDRALSVTLFKEWQGGTVFSLEKLREHRNYSVTLLRDGDIAIYDKNTFWEVARW